MVRLPGKHLPERYLPGGRFTRKIFSEKYIYTKEICLVKYPPEKCPSLQMTFQQISSGKMSSNQMLSGKMS
jgi:hypothetical protein